MAPTEILAQQHYQTIRSILNELDARIVYLTSSTKGRTRVETLEKLRKGQAQFIIGTHALLGSDVDFNKLGFVIIDEQHRFGVQQRQNLKTKAGFLPHLLSMSATPIPRSLALTIYGDLDISIIDQMPPGRQKVETAVASANEREAVYKQIDQQIEKGKQVYVICPLISDSDILGVKSVEAEAERLQNSIFSHRRIAMLHGRLKATGKQTVMSAFSKGELDVLVCTTVVEVGVDIPNATLMLIEGAERFGLATLHQLRGRVGRGANKSFCYLISTQDRQAMQRLSLLERYHDGFTLAQKDLELRGPGAIYGHKQHGLLDLRIANLADTKLLASARAAAKDFVDHYNLGDYPALLARINQLKAVTTLD